MAALELLVSHARRHCTTRARASLLGFHRSLCSSSSSSSSSNPDPTKPDEPPKRSNQSVPIQPVSYAAKPKVQSQPTPEKSPPETLPPQPPLSRRPRQPESESGSAENLSMWTREDIRSVKDASSISDPPQPDEPPKRSNQSVPIQPVSYAAKPKVQSQPTPENSSPETLPPLPRRSGQPEFESGNADNRSMWTREDIRYVKDVPSISPVSYPARVAPLPQDRVRVEAEAEENVEKKEDEVMAKERIRIDVENRIRRRVFRVEEEKLVPFPRLIKVEKKQEGKVILDLMDAIKEVKANANQNFDETVEAHVRLGIDRRRSDMTVRGAATLPHGSGKVVRVAVFAEGTAAEEARAAGADVVGGDDLIDEIKNLHDGGGKLNFDRCIATPQIMPRLTKISRILRSLMPNANRGSVTVDISKAVGEAKRGRVEFRMDKTAIVHVGLGKVSFSEKVLRENIGAFVNALLLAKPSGLKKTSKYAGYVNSFHLCRTMGPGFSVSIQSLSMAADHYNKLYAQ